MLNGITERHVFRSHEERPDDGHRPRVNKKAFINKMSIVWGIKGIGTRQKYRNGRNQCWGTFFFPQQISPCIL